MLRPNRATVSFSFMLIAPISKHDGRGGMPWGFGSPTRERVQGRPRAGCGGCQPINLASEGWGQIAPLDQASALQTTNALGQHAPLIGGIASLRSEKRCSPLP